MRSLIAAALAVLLGACSSPPNVSPTAAGALTAPPSSEASLGPSPSLAASPSAPPSEAPAPTLGPITSEVFPPGAAVEVAVKELNLREEPSTGSKRTQVLKRGTVVIVLPADSISLGWGPVRANGYTWYPVVLANVADPALKLDPLPKSPLVYGGEPISGWVASDNGKQSYLVAVAPRCPATVDLVNVQGMLPAERIACFHEPFVVEGTFGCNGCGGIHAGTFTPRWLADLQEFDLLSADVKARFGPLALHFPPKGQAKPAAGSIIRVTVHIDDPRSSRCSLILEFGESIQVDARTARLWCRERLVVDSYKVLGTDPDF